MDPPEDPNERTPDDRKQTALAAGGLLSVVLAQWALAYASVFSYFLPLFLLGGIGWAVQRRRWVSLAVLVVTSPLSFSFARGVAAYGRNDACMMSVGLQHSGSTFIDSHTRLPVARCGCLSDGNEWVWDSPYNAALYLVSAVAGPPSGTYDGPIPTEGEARDALTEPLPWTGENWPATKSESMVAESSCSVGWARP